jgi:hypothetical protein
MYRFLVVQKTRVFEIGYIKRKSVVIGIMVEGKRNVSRKHGLPQRLNRLMQNKREEKYVKRNPDLGY